MWPHVSQSLRIPFSAFHPPAPRMISKVQYLAGGTGSAEATITGDGLMRVIRADWPAEEGSRGTERLTWGQDCTGAPAPPQCLVGLEGSGSRLPGGLMDTSVIPGGNNWALVGTWAPRRGRWRI